MGKVIVITSGHGGIGKTTVTAYLSTALALIGKTVVVVDADVGPGLHHRDPEILSILRERNIWWRDSNLDTLMGVEARRTAMDVHQKGASLQSVLVEALPGMQSRSKLFEEYIDERLSELRFLASAPKNSVESLPTAQMKAICDELRAAYDFVLIDAPARTDSDFPQAAAGAEQAIVITTPNFGAVRSADYVIKFLSTLQLKLHLIINRVPPMMLRNKKLHRMINRVLPMLKNKRELYQIDPKDVAELLGQDPLGVVPEDESFLAADWERQRHPILGMAPVVMMNSPKTRQAYLRIANRLADM